MATAAIAARAGLIALSTGTSASSTEAIAELRNIRLRVTNNQIDASSNDSSGWDEFILGQRGWTATAESLYATSSGNLYHLWVEAVEDGTAMAFRFMPSTASSATQNWSGSAYIEDYDIGGDTAGLFMNNVTIRGNGALTYSTST